MLVFVCLWLSSFPFSHVVSLQLPGWAFERPWSPWGSPIEWPLPICLRALGCWVADYPAYLAGMLESAWVVWASRAPCCVVQSTPLHGFLTHRRLVHGLLAASHLCWCWLCHGLAQYWDGSVDGALFCRVVCAEARYAGWAIGLVCKPHSI